MRLEVTAHVSSSKTAAKGDEPAFTPLTILTIGDDPVLWNATHASLATTSGAEIEFVDRNSLGQLIVSTPPPQIFIILVPLTGGALPVIQTLNTIAPNSRIVILSDESHITAESLLAAFAAGAHGWLPISLSSQALARTIQAVHNGEFGLGRSHMSLVLATLGTQADPISHLVGMEMLLTPRERQVLFEVSKSATTEQISRTLGMSPATVRWHIGTLLKKLQVTTRAELASHRSEARQTSSAPGLSSSSSPIPAPQLPSENTPTLSEGELKVARKVAQGWTNREIAASLFISTHTVNSHLKRAYAKLGIRSRVELARIILIQEPSTPHRRDSSVS